LEIRKIVITFVPLELTNKLKKEVKIGQYYKPCVLAKDKKTVKKWVLSFDYENGLKLMEHSYVENNFVKAFETLITNNPQHVVWGGDYAEHDIGTEKKGTNTYHRCTDKKQVKPFVPTTTGNFVVNHTKKLYVDKSKMPLAAKGWDAHIHPLPLLTAEGNGQGGGDYMCKGSAKLVGTWARDLISIESEKPTDFKELKVKFTEIE
jgi:hypothetical protein